MSLKSASRPPLYSDSDLYFVVPDFFNREFNYAKSLENGIIIGKDPEFNHQYRVTLRRIRSLCGLLEDILAPFEIKLLKPNLRALMKRTNVLRDLDVFIIDKPRYLNILPQHHASLERIFSIINNRRIAEQQQVAEWLKSREYLNITVLLENSLLRAKKYQRKNKPISPTSYSNDKILNQFQIVTKSTKSISNDSEDKIIHSLRIKCKSLRYLLESFSSIYSSEQHKQNVKHLKFLQDQLGNFNDTSTQIAFFTKFRKDSDVRKADRKTLEALIIEIENKHRLSRQTVLSHIKQFDRFIKENAALDIYLN